MDRVGPDLKETIRDYCLGLADDGDAAEGDTPDTADTPDAADGETATASDWVGRAVAALPETDPHREDLNAAIARATDQIAVNITAGEREQVIARAGLEKAPGLDQYRYADDPAADELDHSGAATLIRTDGGQPPRGHGRGD